MQQKFTYKARNMSGDMESGVIEGSSENTVAKVLVKQGLVPIEITVMSTKQLGGKGLSITLWSDKVSPKDLHLFCRQMYSMVKAGIPVTNTLKRMAESTKNTSFAKALYDMYEVVAGGANLSSAMEKYPKIFPPLLIHLIHVGEITGRLQDSFEQVSEYFSLEIKTLERIKSIMRYPIIVIVAMSLAIVIVNIFVIPAFTNLFKSFNAGLPIFTRVLIGFSNFFLSYWWAMLIGIIGIFIIFKAFVKRPQGKLYWHYFQIKVPIFGKTLEKILLARFARTFLMIIRTGVAVTDGVALVSDSIGNEYFRRKIQEMKRLMEAGQNLASSAKGVNIFPPIIVQMLMVGEDSGELEKMMEEIAAFYEREIDYEIDKLSDIIEPVLLVFIGCMVLLLALGVFLPIWELGSVAQQSGKGY